MYVIHLPTEDKVFYVRYYTAEIEAWITAHLQAEQVGVPVRTFAGEPDVEA